MVFSMVKTDLNCPKCNGTFYQSLFNIGICLEVFQCPKCNKTFFLEDDDNLREYDITI
nr:MAG TPA: hypothetical protein [Caudoviricetes sp.]